MNVRDLEISLRPRKSWEAVDLGFLLTRQHYRDLLKIGLYGFAPLWVLAIVLGWSQPWIPLLVIWLFKPIYDRFCLHLFSRRIFGAEISWQDVLKKAGSFWFRRSLPLLTYRRFSPVRSMVLPIQELEQLKSKAFSSRCTVVKRVGGGTALLTTWVMAFCEILIIAGLFFLIIAFIPQGDSETFEEFYESTARTFSDMGLVFRILIIIYAAVVLLLEPFYMGAGFCLYLNSRSSQEAWDIDLRFKELAGRIHQGKVHQSGGSVAILLLGFLAIIFSSGGLQAQDGPSDDPQAVVEEIYQHEDFTIHTRIIKERVEKDGPQWWEDFKEKWLDWLDKDTEKKSRSAQKGAGADGLMRLFAYGALAVLVVVVLYYLAMVLMQSHKPDLSIEKPILKKKPTVVMGMEVTAKSIPKNLIETAEDAWQAGRFKEALSFLYRGALSQLILEWHADIDDSATEYECMRAARRVLPDSNSGYFDELSKHWICVAYSSNRVSDAQFQSLCQAWPFVMR